MIENPKARLYLTLPHPEVTSPLLSVFAGLSIIDKSCIRWAFPVAQLVKNPPAMRETWVQSLGWEIPWRRESLPTPVFWPGEFHPKGDQSWVFIGRTDAEAETPILWPPHAKSWLIGKDPDAGRDWGQEEKGTAEDEMAGWHYWLDGHEFE